MQWSEVSVRTSHEAMDVVAEIFHDLGASGAEIEDPALINEYISSGAWDYVDLPYSENTETVTVKAYLAADGKLSYCMAELGRRLQELQEKADFPCGSCEVTARVVEDEDWAESWKAFFHTEKIGRRLVIKPTWEAYEPSGGELVIELDPGAAFGTGTHPTTAMCLRELENLVQEGAVVFDVGTGSGVLAIAAARLGASRVMAGDYDATAVRIAGENIRQNGVENIVETGTTDLWSGFSGRAQVISANLIADLVISLLPGLEEHLAPCGHLLASGIITERAEDVKAAVERNGLALVKIIEDSGWVAMVIGRPGE